jgi:hypothetical protein
VTTMANATTSMMTLKAWTTKQTDALRGPNNLGPVHHQPRLPSIFSIARPWRREQVIPGSSSNSELARASTDYQVA